MRMTQAMVPTLRSVPAEAEIISHQLLLRAGFIRKTAAGMYNYLPLGKRVLTKIETIVREEMDAAGGQEILMPITQLCLIIWIYIQQNYLLGILINLFATI